MKRYLVDHERLNSLVIGIFRRSGLKDEDAKSLASMLIRANLRGLYSHGVLRVGTYLDRIKAGGMKTDYEIRVLRDTPATALVDGGDGPGAAACEFAARLAREKAEKCGLGMVTLRNTEHTGMISLWSLIMSGEDMIGFTGTAIEPLMAPTGGKELRVGNNPFAFTIPAGKYPPICLDISCSMVSGGKVLAKKLEKEPVPLGWCLDENGLPTTDPEKWRFLVPMGEHKGYGLSVIVECLGSLLSGGPFGEGHGQQYGKMNEPNRVNSFYLAVNIGFFRELDGFLRDTEAYIDYLHSCEKAPGVSRIYYPGELEEEHTKKALAEGIELEENLVRDLMERASKVGFSPEETAFLTQTPSTDR